MLRSAIHRLTVSLALTLAVVPAPVAQSRRVAEDARQIRAFRLADDHLPKLREVAASLSRGFTPTPDRPRADAARFVIIHGLPSTSTVMVGSVLVEVDDSAVFIESSEAGHSSVTCVRCCDLRFTGSRFRSR